jgi:iron complex transport system ATP-binding protein
VVVHLSARGIDFTYAGEGERVDALRGIDLEVQSGELLAILGPNGAGKSTLLRVLAGILKPEKGELFVAGRSASRWSARERARHIALVPQSLTTLPDVTVEAFVGYGRYARHRTFRGPRKEDRTAVQSAIIAADLDTLADRPLAELSGGQRQRALIARALAQEARTLLVDEPTNALDPSHQLRVLNLLADLSESGRSVVVVTHELNLASQFAQRAMLLHAGRSVACASIEEVLVRDVLEPVYGSQLTYGSMNAARAGGARPFVLPWVQ